MSKGFVVAGLLRLILFLIIPSFLEASEVKQDFPIAKSCLESVSNKLLNNESFDYKLIDSLIEFASEHRNKGEPDIAIEVLGRALDFAESSRDKARLAIIHGGLSDAYLLSRRLDIALSSAEKSLVCAQQSSHALTYLTALNNYANVLVAMQRYEQALATYQESITLAKQQADPLMTVKLQINMIHVYLAEHSVDKAIQILKRTSLALIKIPPSHEKSYLLIALGHLAQRIYIENNQSDLLSIAHSKYTEALKLSSRLEDIRGKSYALGHLGELYTAEQGYADAEQLFQQAIFLANQINAPEIIARWWWQRGRLLKAQNKTLKAETAYRKALKQLGYIQPAMIYGVRGNPQSFRETVGIIYLELLDILLHKAASKKDQNEKRKILNEVREFMEKFKTVDLKNYFQDDCVAELQAKNEAKNIDDIISSGTAILYPIIFADRVALLLSLADGSIKQYSAPISVEDLTKQVISFRHEFNRSGNLRRLRSAGWVLYDLLIMPLEPDLTRQKVKTIVVVPDGILGTIPFAAFFDGEEFLVNQYAFVTSPGLSLTLSSKKPWNEKNQRALLNGLSKNDQQFKRLPNVLKEIEKVSSQFTSSTQLLDEAFDKQSVENHLQQQSYTTVLFASHAELKANPKQSFILTYDDKILLNDLSRLLRIGQYRDNPVDLLVLSACDTARGDERAAFGLAGVAVKAGVSSVLASLWAVSDESTSEIIPLFFKNLKNSKLSKALALQKAQKQLLKSAEYSHPFHWASFVLFGDWL